MNTVDLLGSTLGLGFLAGLRLYATVLIVGLVVRFHWISLPPSFSGLSVLSNRWILSAAAAAATFEFLADKVPWFDSLWDSIHTVIRPAGAILLGATAASSEDPVTRTVIALLCGGVAFTGHSTKAATRLFANHSPEPFTNFGLSLAGDIFVPVAFWMLIKHRDFALGSMALFVVLFAWFSPAIFRSLRVECIAIGSLFSKFFSLPPEQGSAECVRCSAGRGVKGLNNSVGSLCREPDGYVFTTKRLFRTRTHQIPLDHITGTRLYRGLLVDGLTLVVDDYEQVFDIFKVHRTMQPQWLVRLFRARAGFPATSS
ncbi:MAG: DUF4126 domain-containing protein [Bryobacteraceae bacterium]